MELREEIKLLERKVKLLKELKKLQDEVLFQQMYPVYIPYFVPNYPILPYQPFVYGSDGTANSNMYRDNTTTTVQLDTENITYTN